MSEVSFRFHMYNMRKDQSSQKFLPVSLVSLLLIPVNQVGNNDHYFYSQNLFYFRFKAYFDK